MSKLNNIPNKDSLHTLKSNDLKDAALINVNATESLMYVASETNNSFLSKLQQTIQSVLSTSDNIQNETSNNQSADLSNAKECTAENASSPFPVSVEENLASVQIGECTIATAISPFPITQDNATAEIIGLTDSEAGLNSLTNGLPGLVESIPRNLTLEDIEALQKAAAGGDAEGGHSEDLFYNPYGLPYLVQSVPRDLGIENLNFGLITVFLPPLNPQVTSTPVTPPGQEVCHLNANDDHALVTINEDICACGHTTNVTTTLTGDINVLANDSDNGIPIIVSKIAFDDQSVDLQNGKATIQGQYGTLTINSDGSYTYVLDPNVIPKNTDVEIFKYTVISEDQGGCVKTANLEIDFNTIIHNEPQAVDDCATLTVNENVKCCNTEIVSTKLSGDINVLANDKNLAGENAVIQSVSFDGKQPVDLVNGQAIIAGQFGTLTLHADGSYQYVLDPNITPKTGETDVFKYTLFDADSNCASTADLKINIDVNATIEPCNPPPCDNNPPVCNNPPCDNKPPVCNNPPCDNKPPVVCNNPPCDNKPPVVCNNPPCDNKPPVCNNPPCDNKPPVNNPPCESKGCATIQVQFESTSASYDNTFGYYIKDCAGNPTTGVILWAGAHEVSGTPTVTISGVNPADIGYFIIPNGAGDNSNLTNGEHVQFVQVNGAWVAEPAGSSTPIEGTGNGGATTPIAYFDNPALNVDGFNHLQTNNGTLSWEDLYNGGDKDFNDVVVKVTSQSCDSKGNINHCEDKHHQDHNYQDHHKNNNHCESQSFCGNMFKNSDGHSSDCDNKVIGFQYINEHHKLVDGKCGETVTTCSGNQFTMHDNGNFTLICHDNSKSFNDEIHCTTCDSHGNKDTSSFCIHTDDIEVNEPDHTKHDRNSDHQDYFIDANDVTAKCAINMKDCGIDFKNACKDNNNHKNGDLPDILGGSSHSSNDHSSSNSHPCLPPVIVNHPCVQNPVEHHFQQVTHEVHMMK